MIDIEDCKFETKFFTLDELLTFLSIVKGKDIFFSPKIISEWIVKYLPNHKIEAKIFEQILGESEIIQDFITEIERMDYLSLRISIVKTYTERIYEILFFEKERISKCLNIIVDSVVFADKSDEAIINLYDKKLFSGGKGLCMLESVAIKKSNAAAYGLLAQELQKWHYCFNDSSKYEKLCKEYALKAIELHCYDYVVKEVLSLFTKNECINIVRKIAKDDSSFNIYEALPIKYYDMDLSKEAICKNYYGFICKEYFELCDMKEAQLRLELIKEKNIKFDFYTEFPVCHFTYKQAKKAITDGYVNLIEDVRIWCSYFSAEQAEEIVDLAIKNGGSIKLYGNLAFKYAYYESECINISRADEVCYKAYLEGYHEIYRDVFSDIGSGLYPYEVWDKEACAFGEFANLFYKRIFDRTIPEEKVEVDEILRLCVFFNEYNKDVYEFWKDVLERYDIDVNLDYEYIEEKEREHYNIIFKK